MKGRIQGTLGFQESAIAKPWNLTNPSTGAIALRRTSVGSKPFLIENNAAN
jgi:hypothetical protein